MTPIELSHPVYHDENAARNHLEAIRWPNGPICPYCDSAEKIRPLNGNSMGPGWYYCGACQDKFTVRVGAIYERSHIPLHKWLLAFRLMASSKKGVSAHQLHRTLNITYKSSWFLAHRIREAMKDTDPTPIGGEGKTIEADEAFLGRPEYVYKKGPRKWQQKRGVSTKVKVLTVLERGGKARSIKFDALNARTIGGLLLTHADTESTLNTDESKLYILVGKKFSAHKTVHHRHGEYVKDGATTNTVEGFFSIFKRGMKGIYQHCGEQHLQRYLSEFDFRYSNRAALGVNDAARTTLALRGAAGKRLTYRRPNNTGPAA